MLSPSLTRHWNQSQTKKIKGSHSYITQQTLSEADNSIPVTIQDFNKNLESSIHLVIHTFKALKSHFVSDINYDHTDIFQLKIIGKNLLNDKFKISLFRVLGYVLDPRKMRKTKRGFQRLVIKMKKYGIHQFIFIWRLYCSKNLRNNWTEKNMQKQNTSNKQRLRQIRIKSSACYPWIQIKNKKKEKKLMMTTDWSIYGCLSYKIINERQSIWYLKMVGGGWNKIPNHVESLSKYPVHPDIKHWKLTRIQCYPQTLMVF